MESSNKSILAVYPPFDFQSVGNTFGVPVSTDKTFEHQLLEEIFHEDEDGIMQCDLSMFTSDKVRPEIREFISSHLMQKQGAIVPSVPADGLSDQEIIDFSPSAFDTLASYTQRLSDYFSNLKNETESNS